MIHSDHGPDRIRATEAMEYPGGIPGSVGSAPRNVTTLAHISVSSARFPKSGRRQHKHDTAQMCRPMVFKIALSATTGILHRRHQENHPSLCRPQRGDESGYRPAQSSRKGRTMNKICKTDSKTDDEKP